MKSISIKIFIFIISFSMTFSTDNEFYPSSCKKVFNIVFNKDISYTPIVWDGSTSAFKVDVELNGSFSSCQSTRDNGDPHEICSEDVSAMSYLSFTDDTPGYSENCSDIPHPILDRYLIEKSPPILAGPYEPFNYDSETKIYIGTEPLEVIWYKTSLDPESQINRRADWNSSYAGSYPFETVGPTYWPIPELPINLNGAISIFDGMDKNNIEATTRTCLWLDESQEEYHKINSDNIVLSDFCNSISLNSEDWNTKNIEVISNPLNMVILVNASFLKDYNTVVNFTGQENTQITHVNDAVNVQLSQLYIKNLTLVPSKHGFTNKISNGTVSHIFSKDAPINYLELNEVKYLEPSRVGFQHLWAKNSELMDDSLNFTIIEGDLLENTKIDTGIDNFTVYSNLISNVLPETICHTYIDPKIGENQRCNSQTKQNTTSFNFASGILDYFYGTASEMQLESSTFIINNSTFVSKDGVDLDIYGENSLKVQNQSMLKNVSIDGFNEVVIGSTTKLSNVKFKNTSSVDIYDENIEMDRFLDGESDVKSFIKLIHKAGNIYQSYGSHASYLSPDTFKVAVCRTLDVQATPNSRYTLNFSHTNYEISNVEQLNIQLPCVWERLDTYLLRTIFGYEKVPIDNQNLAACPSDINAVTSPNKNPFNSPVYLESGDYFKNEIDIVVKTIEKSLEFSRYYLASNQHFGAMGAKWNPSNIIKAFPFSLPEKGLTVHWDKGNSTTLYHSSDNHYIAKNKAFSAQFDVGDPFISLQRTDGTTFLFKDVRTVSAPNVTNYVIVSESDTGLYKKVYEYNQEAQLIRVGEVPVNQSTIASNHPQINILYNSNGLIDQVSNNGREIHNYNYDTDGRLISYSSLGYLQKHYLYENQNHPFYITKVLNQNSQAIGEISYSMNGQVSHYNEDQEEGYFYYDENSEFISESKATPIGFVEVTAQFEDRLYTTEINNNGYDKYVRWDQNRNQIVDTMPNGHFVVFEYNPDKTLSKRKTLSQIVPKSTSTESMFLQSGTLYTYEYINVQNTPLIETLKVTGNDGQEILSSFEYNENADLTKSCSQNVCTLFQYNNSDQLETITKEVFDNQVLISSVIESALSYNIDGRVHTVQNRMKYDDQTPYIDSLEYDSWGNVIKKTSGREFITEFTYNQFNQVETITISSYSDPSESIEISQTYDNQGRLKRRSMPNNRFTELIYDKFNNIININDQFGRSFHFKYDNFGNLIEFDNTIGNKTIQEFDRFNRLIATTDIAGYQKTIQYNLSHQPIQAVDANGNESIQEYDEFNRLHKSILSLDQGANLEQSYRYDSLGKLNERVSLYGNKTTLDYDESHRLYKSTLTNITQNLSQINSFSYDSENRMSSTSFAGLQNSTNIDYSSRTQTITDSLNRTTINKLDVRGNVIQQTNALGELKTFEYDYLFRLIKQTNAQNQSIVYHYDDNSNIFLKEYKDENDTLVKSETNSYNLGNQLTQKTLTDFLTQNTIDLDYSYDKEGNMVKVSEGLHKTIHMTYNELSQLTLISYPFLHRLVSHVYDGNGNKVQSFIEDTKNSEVSIQIYDYDSLNRLTSVYDSNYGAVNIRFFDQQSPLVQTLRKEVTLHDGVKVRHYKDGLQRLTKISYLSPDQNVIGAFTYEYDQQNRISSKSYFDGTNDFFENYRYDDGHRLISTETELGTISYVYDDNDNLMEYRNSLDNTKDKDFTQNPSYLDQSTGVDYVNQDIQLDHSINELGQATQFDYVKDQKIQNRKLEFDAFNRLSNVNVQTSNQQGQADSTVTTVAFDYLPGSRLRYKKSVDKNGVTSTEHYFYDGPNEISKLDQNFKSIQQFIINPTMYDMRYGLSLIGESTNQVYQFLSNHQNTVKSLIKDNNTTNTFQLESNGVAVVVTDQRISDMLFTGRPYDDEIGLHYFRGRYLDSCSNRFVNEDPMQHGNNYYSYVNGNPVNYTDPTGYASWKGKQFYWPTMEYRKTDPLMGPSEVVSMLKDMGTDEIVESKPLVAFNTLSVYAYGTDLADRKKTKTDATIGLACAAIPIFGTRVKKIVGPFLEEGMEQLMGRYGKVKGHHVHSKAAFKDHLQYNLDDGFSISQKFMDNFNLDHSAMTRHQRHAFKELYQSGRKNTLSEHTRIAVEALQAGGATKEVARSLVAKSLNELRKRGITTPTNIPWYNK